MNLCTEEAFSKTERRNRKEERLSLIWTDTKEHIYLYLVRIFLLIIKTI